MEPPVGASTALIEASSTSGHGLDGKIAIVTGAANGIGREVATRLAAEGARVVVADLDERGADVAGDLGDAGAFVRFDLADPNQVAAVVPAALDRFGQVDVLCNVAGVSGSLRRFLDDDLRDLDRVLSVDLAGPLLLTHHVARHLAARAGADGAGAGRGGAIVNVASGAGITPGVGMVPYRAAKAGIAHLTRCLAVELGEHGIRVNCVAPANIATDINAAFDKAAVTQLQPLPHRGATGDVADAVVFLAGARAAHITGVVLPIDGGMSVGVPPRRPVGATPA